MPRASRNVSGRVLSTMPTKPSMPSERISHMKSKRFWPGVPNKYSTSSSSTLMRPKSMATVVVSFIFSAWSVILRSVETTSISLTEWIKAVFPELKGPVTTILTVRIETLRSSQKPNACDQAGDERHLVWPFGQRLNDRRAWSGIALQADAFDDARLPSPGDEGAGFRG